MIPAGLELAISWFVVRRLIHWATGPDATLNVKYVSESKLFRKSHTLFELLVQVLFQYFAKIKMKTFNQKLIILQKRESSASNWNDYCRERQLLLYCQYQLSSNLPFFDILSTRLEFESVCSSACVSVCLLINHRGVGVIFGL